MEGRTIVRPDVQQLGLVGAGRLPFNGGPDNRPARPGSSGVSKAQPPTFNGGPDNRPARPRADFRYAKLNSALQWRAGQSSGQTSHRRRVRWSTLFLQWRAGQSSGQTWAFDAATTSFAHLQWRAGQSSGQTSSWRAFVPINRQPSMGGPDKSSGQTPSSWPAEGTSRTLQWRAGQSSGQTSSWRALCPSTANLQWRAGQSSGPDAVVLAGRRHFTHPSMEGRTIVRPDATCSHSQPETSSAFNGGTDNRPARLEVIEPEPAPKPRLQWRAGQSSGQTRSNRAGACAETTPSMEGRTIVRPDLQYRHNVRIE